MQSEGSPHQDLKALCTHHCNATNRNSINYIHTLATSNGSQEMLISAVEVETKFNTNRLNKNTNSYPPLIGIKVSLLTGTELAVSS